MAYTTNQLISAAYYSSGVVSREFETVSGSQISDGLQWLNDILTDKRVDKGMVPYETVYTQPFRVGVSKYFIPNLIEIDTLVFYLNNVRYPMQYDKRNNFFGSARVEDIQSLPGSWYFERQVGGGNLHIYFSPDQDYPMEIHGVFNVNPVALGQNLLSNVTTADLGVPKFYGTNADVNGGSLAPGQFVVNEVDLMGNYANIGALINYINSGIIPGVTASLNVNNFVLSSTTEPPLSIYVRTNGYPNETNFIGNITVATTAPLLGFVNYGNGPNTNNPGVGSTLTSSSPAVLSIDGHPVVVGERVLIKNQTDASQNGSYIMTILGTGGSPWVLTRTSNYDEPVEINEGNIFTALLGNTNKGHSFVQTGVVSAVGTNSNRVGSAIVFTIFNALTFSNFSTIETPLYDVFNATGFDQFYVTYLRYALANRICSEYNYVVPRGVAEQLAEYQAWIRKKSRVIDLRMQKSSSLQTRGPYGWAQINLGKGWFSSSY